MWMKCWSSISIVSLAKCKKCIQEVKKCIPLHLWAEARSWLASIYLHYELLRKTEQLYLKLIQNGLLVKPPSSTTTFHWRCTHLRLPLVILIFLNPLFSFCQRSTVLQEVRGESSPTDACFPYCPFSAPSTLLNTDINQQLSVGDHASSLVDKTDKKYFHFCSISHSSNHWGQGMRDPALTLFSKAISAFACSLELVKFSVFICLHAQFSSESNEKCSAWDCSLQPSFYFALLTHFLVPAREAGKSALPKETSILWLKRTLLFCFDGRENNKIISEKCWKKCFWNFIQLYCDQLWKVLPLGSGSLLQRIIMWQQELCSYHKHISTINLPERSPCTALSILTCPSFTSHHLLPLLMLIFS